MIVEKMIISRNNSLQQMGDQWTFCSKQSFFLLLQLNAQCVINFLWIWMENHCIILVIIRRIASFSPYHSFNENVLNSKLIICIPPIRTYVSAYELTDESTYYYVHRTFMYLNSKKQIGICLLFYFSVKLQIK